MVAASTVRPTKVMYGSISVVVKVDTVSRKSCAATLKSRSVRQCKPLYTWAREGNKSASKAGGVKSAHARTGDKPPHLEAVAPIPIAAFLQQGFRLGNVAGYQAVVVGKEP